MRRPDEVMDCKRIEGRTATDHRDCPLRSEERGAPFDAPRLVSLRSLRLRTSRQIVFPYAPTISLASALTYESGKLSWLKSAVWRAMSAAAWALPLAL